MSSAALSLTIDVSSKIAPAPDIRPVYFQSQGGANLFRRWRITLHTAVPPSGMQDHRGDAWGGTWGGMRGKPRVQTAHRSKSAPHSWFGESTALKPAHLQRQGTLKRNTQQSPQVGSKSGRIRVTDALGAHIQTFGGCWLDCKLLCIIDSVGLFFGKANGNFFNSMTDWT